MSAPQTTNWPAAWAHLASLKGNAWDAETEILEGVWKAEYRAAFIACAMARKWDDEENAGLWCDDYETEAVNACWGGKDTPQESAEVDFQECEKEGRYCADK